MYAKFKMKLGRARGVSTYSGLVSVLDLDSPTLSTLQENFQKILPQTLLAKLQLFCFYEIKELAIGVSSA
jgi:hypothetical protein